MQVAQSFIVSFLSAERAMNELKASRGELPRLSGVQRSQLEQGFEGAKTAKELHSSASVLLASTTLANAALTQENIEVSKRYVNDKLGVNQELLDPMLIKMLTKS
eukprot:2962242-Pyramimonas_sp.AAC.1